MTDHTNTATDAHLNVLGERQLSRYRRDDCQPGGSGMGPRMYCRPGGIPGLAHCTFFSGRRALTSVRQDWRRASRSFTISGFAAARSVDSLRSSLML